MQTGKFGELEREVQELAALQPDVSGLDQRQTPEAVPFDFKEVLR